MERPVVRWWWLPIIVAADWALALAANVGFRRGWPGLDTLTANVASLVLMFGLLILLGGLRTRDLPAIGIRPGAAWAGIAFGVVLWAAWQFTIVGTAWAFGRPWEIAGRWQEAGIVHQIRRIAGQVLGNALYEEIVYRGLITSQLMAWARFRFEPEPTSRRVAVAGAFALAQLAFAGRHLPQMLLDGEPSALAIALLAANGASFAAVFLLTDNVFAAVGFHAALNLPLVTLTAGGDGDEMLAALAIHLLAWAMAWLWYLFRRRISLRRQAPAPRRRRRTPDTRP